MERFLSDGETTYLPLDKRPADGLPATAEPPYLGRALVRVRAKWDGLPTAERAPVDPARPTARSTNLWRRVRPDELPVPERMTAVETVTDDAGWNAFHGQRLQGEEPHPGDNEHGADRREQVRVGGLLVSRREGGWALWRILPHGPAAVLEGKVDEDLCGGEHQIVARALDRDLREAFRDAATKHGEPSFCEETARALARWEPTASAAATAAASEDS